jgi:hypothetical protein
VAKKEGGGMMHGVPDEQDLRDNKEVPLAHRLAMGSKSDGMRLKRGGHVHKKEGGEAKAKVSYGATETEEPHPAKKKRGGGVKKAMGGLMGLVRNEVPRIGHSIRAKTTGARPPMMKDGGMVCKHCGGKHASEKCHGGRMMKKGGKR